MRLDRSPLPNQTDLKMGLYSYLTDILDNSNDDKIRLECINLIMRLLII